MLLIVTSVLLVACKPENDDNGGGNGNGNDTVEKGPAIINNSGSQNVVLRIGQTFDPMEGITATDAGLGDVTNKIELDDGSLDVNEVATYTLKYKITGSDGELYEYERRVEVKDVEIIGLRDRKISVGGYFNEESGVSVIDPVLGTLYAHNKDHREEYIEITGDVDVSVPGDYQVTYKITIGEYVNTIIRVITVVNDPTIIVPGGGEVERLEYGTPFDPMTSVTAHLPVLTEKPLQEVDENGEPVVDEDGKPVYVPKLDEDGEPMFDEDDNPIYETKLDEDGNPVMIYVTKGVTDFVRVTGAVNVEEPGTYTLTYKIQDPDNPLEFVKDLEGNEVVVERVIEVYVVVEIRGLSPLQVTQDADFANDVEGMSGVTGFDSVKGIITGDITVIGSVNTARVGVYTLTYLLTGTNGISVTETRQITVVPPLEGLQTIVFMSGNVLEHDPFLDGFTGTNQRLRQQLHEAAEERHNVEIVYKPYPDNAGWGPDRINAIIQSTIDGEPLADVYYHVTTDWLAQLAGGGALAPIDQYILPGQPGEKVDQTYIDAATLGGHAYGFSTGALNLESGLYFNIDLLEQLGIPNPTEIYLGDGTNIGENWRWSDFKDWAVAAQAKLSGLGDDYNALGGTIFYYAENLVPLNGGQFLDMDEGVVRFGEEPAMETYDFIHDLYLENLFEVNRAQDQGSNEWQAGKVLMHPGDLWFLRADNRWGDLEFDLGFVPYPMGDDYDGEYKSPIYGSSVSYLASGHSPDKTALSFAVWADIQYWESDFMDPEEAYRLNLERFFNDDLYIDAYMTVYNKTYVEFLNAIGVSSYGAHGYRVNLNGGIPQGEHRSRIEAIIPQYQYRLSLFLEGK